MATNTMSKEKIEMALKAKNDEVKNMLSKYVLFKNLDEFFHRNASAIQDLVKGRAISGVMYGFTAADNQEKMYDARIELRKVKNETGGYYTIPKFHFKREKLDFNISLPDGNREKVAINLSESDIEQLKETGRLDHSVKVGEGKNEREYFIAVDKDLNALAAVSTRILKVNNTIKGAVLTEENKQELLSGQKTLINMPIKNDETKPMLVYFNPVLRNIAFEEAKPNQANTKQAQKQGQEKKAAVRASVAAKVDKQSAEKPEATQSQAKGQKI